MVFINVSMYGGEYLCFGLEKFSKRSNWAYVCVLAYQVMISFSPSHKVTKFPQQELMKGK